MKNIIIIPYRNRQKHLDYFLANSAPLLKKNIDNLEIIIVEQNEGKIFNRGILLNIGFHYYNNPDYYYITQDVDINPIHKETLEQYNKDVSKNFLRIFSSHCGTLGGVIKFKGSIFQKINGFPNNHWGWGHEDKNLKNRADFYKVICNTFMETNNKKRDEYFLRFDDINDRIKSKDVNKKYYNNYRLFEKLNQQKKLEYINQSGINNLQYKILEDIQINDFIKKIKVDV
jgi:hypothetical protein